MSNAFVLPAAPAPPAPAAPQAVNPARDRPDPAPGTSFKEALAAAQKPEPEKPADTTAPADKAKDAPAEPNPKPAEASPGDETDDNSPLKQALMAALAALAMPLAQPQPQPAVASAASQTPTEGQPSAQPSAVVATALPVEPLIVPDDQPKTATPAQPLADKMAQFADLIKVQAKAMVEPQATAPEAAVTPAQPLPAGAEVKIPEVKLQVATETLEALAGRPKPVIEKSPGAPPQEVAALPQTVGLVNAAAKFNVSELARLSEAPTGNGLPLVSQIQQGLETLAKSGNTSLRLQLYPESMGRVDLRLTSGADGVRVSLTADLAATGNLLERHAQELRQTLTDSGLTLAGLSIGLSLGQGKSSTAFEWQPPNSGRTPVPGSAATLEPGLDEVLSPRSLDSGRVDYRI